MSLTLSETPKRGFVASRPNYDIEKMEVKYIGEGMLNEEFVVNTWQDKEIPFTIHFVVTKQGKVSFVGRFSYCNNPNCDDNVS